MAARMIPNLELSDIPDKGERAVYQALRDQLPDDWTVFFHYTYCVNRPRFWLGDGEADFIVVAPQRGVMVLEVKQSHGIECINGQWFRIKPDESREKADNPFDQAMRHKFNIVKNILVPRMSLPNEQFPGTFGHAVVYPFGRVAGKLPPSQNLQVIVTYDDIPHLLSRLKEAFEAWGSAENGGKFTTTYFERVTKILTGDTKLVIVAAASADEESAQIECLTRNQNDTFRNVLAKNRVRISGPAGSGKTMLAVWTAEALASLGQSVLLLCFNKPLQTWIEAKYSPPENVLVRNFHTLCRDYASQAGIPFEPPPATAENAALFWQTKSPIILDKATMALGDSSRFDAVIVDEAQDFHPDSWISIQLLLKDPGHGHFYIFHDRDQAGLYGTGQTFPADIDYVYQLTENCRNTKKVATYCGNVLESTIASFPLAPEGIVPELKAALPNINSRAAAVRQVVNNWLQSGFKPSRICVLSPWTRKNASCSLPLLDSIANLPIVGDLERFDDWLADRVIWGTTIKSFKGLEADCVVITDIPPVGTVGFSKTDMYVAASRAKHRLAFVPSSAAAHAEVSQWLSHH